MFKKKPSATNPFSYLTVLEETGSRYAFLHFGSQNDGCYMDEPALSGKR